MTIRTKTPNAMNFSHPFSFMRFDMSQVKNAAKPTTSPRYSSFALLTTRAAILIVT